MALVFNDTDLAGVLENKNIDNRSGSVNLIIEATNQKFLDDWDFIRSQATGALATFLDLIQAEYMIENVMFIIRSVVNKSDLDLVISKCKKFGFFPRMKSVLAFENNEDTGLLELFRTVLVDTPISKYFERYFDSLESDNDEGVTGRLASAAKQFNEQDIDIIQNSLNRYWLEDFYNYCTLLGGESTVAMQQLLSFEADKRALSIIVNSFGTALNEPDKRISDRNNLFCAFGTFYPEYVVTEVGAQDAEDCRFCQVDDLDKLRNVLDTGCSVYKALAEELASGKSDVDMDVETWLYHREVELMRLAFEGQAHFAVFWAYTKLMERQQKNLFWILTCISQKQKDPQVINSRWIPIF